MATSIFHRAGTLAGNKMFALGRLKAGERNSTEAKYEEQLKAELAAGHILWYDFEAVTLKLADGLRYTPDFVVMHKDGVLEMREVKGYWQDDAKAKIKMAARLFPFRFMAVYKQTKKNGGGWETESF